MEGGREDVEGGKKDPMGARGKKEKREVAGIEGGEGRVEEKGEDEENKEGGRISRWKGREIETMEERMGGREG